MPYESEMRELAEGFVAANGPLKEVSFLRSNDRSLLVFDNGTVLPTWVTKTPRGDPGIQRLMKLPNGDATLSVLQRVADRLGGTDPLTLLTFGYSGTGPACFAVFLGAAGFQETEVADLEAPVKLRPDGSRITGTERGEVVEWEDGGQTPI